ARVRLLRDDVVIHDGTLKSLRRCKDEVREVQQGYECGMAVENYQDTQVGDRVECYEIQEVARTLCCGSGPQQGGVGQGHPLMARSRGKAPSQRQLRVGELIRHELALLLNDGSAHDPILRSASIT